MRNVIHQSIVLPIAAEQLFEQYLDPVRHAQITGAPVHIDREPGSEFRAFEGAIWGRMLAVAAPRLVVQSWRSVNFASADPDSTLILSFAPDVAGGRIDLLHIDVPVHDHEGVIAGWERFYWGPWRQYLVSS